MADRKLGFGGIGNTKGARSFAGKAQETNPTNAMPMAVHHYRIRRA